MAPFLSLLIPSFNRDNFLSSVLGIVTREVKPYGNQVEIIVRDNLSDQDIESVIRKHSQEFPIDFKINPVRINIMQGIRDIVKDANGAYIWMLGDDDLPYAGSIDKVIKTLKRFPEIEFIVGNCNIWNANNADIAPNTLPENCQSSYSRYDRFEDAYLSQYRQLTWDKEMFCTGHYNLIFRRWHWRKAVEPIDNREPFSALEMTVPTAAYVYNNLLDRPAYYIGQPLLLCNYNVAWHTANVTDNWNKFYNQCRQLYEASHGNRT